MSRPAKTADFGPQPAIIAAAKAPAGRGAGPARRYATYLNRPRIDWGAELAMDNAWMPSCCLVCRACRWALSLARSASTRLPTPAVIVSWSLPTNVRFEAIDFDAVPNLASAALTLLIDVCTVPIIAVAWVTVPIVPVAATVMLAPPTDRSWACTVSTEVPVELARAATLEAPLVIRLMPLKLALFTTCVIWFR